jgi:methionine synthase / methylenetetrahydrofolate reductase(NADPH)
MSRSFLERLHSEILVFDGAMGTSLYGLGVHLGRCFDALNIEDPDLVRQVHEDYIQAGALVIQTNTFGANPFKLKEHQKGDQLEEINRQGVRIARQAAGDNVLVAASVGPLGIKMEPWGRVSADEVRRAFHTQISVLHDEGIDVVLLETFTDPLQLIEGIKACREVSPDLPVIAQITLDKEGNSFYGAPLEEVIPRVVAAGPDVVGINCSVGPEVMLASLERVLAVTDLPVSVQPNAGYPKQMDERCFYLSSPDYFARYGRLFVEAGARIVGGCCGTTPEHIRVLNRALRATVTPKDRVQVTPVGKAVEQELPSIPMAEKSNLGARIAAGKFVATVEIMPPRGWDLSNIIALTGEMEAAGFDAVNIPDGPRASARLSPMATAVTIRQSLKRIEPVLHYVCRDRNLLGMQADILGAYTLGIRNMLLITGDPPIKGDYPEATPVFDVDAIGLVNLVNHLNHGHDVGDRKIGKPTGFLIGVGVNPTAVNFEREMERFQRKVEAGAEYAVTQPVFDLEALERMLEAIQPYRIPILAGIWPLQSLRNAEFLNNEVPGVDIPDSILEQMARVAGDPGAERDQGLTIALEMAREVLPKVAGLQISAPFNRGEVACRMLQELQPDIAALKGERDES